jgi:hypothetical protein
MQNWKHEKQKYFVQQTELLAKRKEFPNFRPPNRFSNQLRVTGKAGLLPEIIDTVFAKTSPKRSFSMTEYERFGLVFTKTRVYKFGHNLGLLFHWSDLHTTSDTMRNIIFIVNSTYEVMTMRSIAKNMKGIITGKTTF